MTDPTDARLDDAWERRVTQHCVTGDYSHAWQRAASELSLSGPSTKDRNFSCGRAGCGARRIDRWNGERWIVTVYPAGVPIPAASQPTREETPLTDEQRGAGAAEIGRARVPPPGANPEEWLKGYDEQTRRMVKPWGRPSIQDPRADDAKTVDPAVQAVRDRTRELETPQG